MVGTGKVIMLLTIGAVEKGIAGRKLRAVAVFLNLIQVIKINIPKTSLNIQILNKIYIFLK
jgi:hypothetical protein